MNSMRPSCLKRSESWSRQALEKWRQNFNCRLSDPATQAKLATVSMACPSAQ
jgi:hypothetical protein